MRNSTKGRDHYRSLWDRYQKMLMLSSFPVAVKMLEDATMLEEIKDERGRPLRKIKNNLAICQLLGQARYWGAVQGGAADMLSMCVSGSALLGFSTMPENYADGYVRAYFTEEEFARKTMEMVPHFEPGAYEAMVVAPLEKTPVDPDVVIFFPNAAQLLMLTSGYTYNKGGKIDAEFSMAGTCSRPIVSPMKTGKPNIFNPTNGARILGFPSDNELMFSIPAESLEDLIEGLEFIHRGMIVYPTPWQHLNWEPQGIVRNAIQGKGLYPPEHRHPERKKN